MTISPVIFAGGINNTYVVTTADDSTTTLTVNNLEDVLVTGTGVLHWIDLGVGTTYKVGKRYRVENASSEIIGVMNSDSTVWVRLGQHESCACTLVDNSTAAGVWHVVIHRIGDPSFGFRVVDDFVTYSTPLHGPIGWSVTNSGAGAASSVSSLALDTDTAFGVTYQTPGTTTTGFTHFRSCLAIQLGDGPVSFRDRILISALSTVAEEYWLRIGILDDVAGDAVDGVYFENDRLTHGDTFWRICSASNSTRTKTATATNPRLIGGGLYQNLYLEVSSDASRADFWIDNVHQGTVATNIPSGSARVSTVTSVFTKSAGTTAINLYRDLIEIVSLIGR
jgi:hypothetical protein